MFDVRPPLRRPPLEPEGAKFLLPEIGEATLVTHATDEDATGKAGNCNESDCGYEPRSVELKEKAIRVFGIGGDEASKNASDGEIDTNVELRIVEEKL